MLLLIQSLPMVNGRVVEVAERLSKATGLLLRPLVDLFSIYDPDEGFIAPFDLPLTTISKFCVRLATYDTTPYRQSTPMVE